jgi:tRNA dimethylallyltransferase
VLPAIVIVGTTAVGKTELSLEVAKAFNAEIINADSMQLYKGMDIGTAKLPVEQRQGITHHMLDVLDVTTTASVSDYQKSARPIIQSLAAQGKRSVVVGGSGLFIQGLLEDMQFPEVDHALRDELQRQADELGAAAMYQMLVEADPAAAANVAPENTRRVIRALEVIELTGSAPITELKELPEVIPSIRIGLRRDRSELDPRIEKRVELMWEQGFVEEVEQLEKVGLRDGVTARKALGYAQILDYLAGELTLAQAKEQTIFATRRYARRQDSWFNRDAKIHWLDASTADLSTVTQLVNKNG